MMTLLLYNQHLIIYDETEEFRSGLYFVTSQKRSIEFCIRDF